MTEDIVPAEHIQRVLTLVAELSDNDTWNMLCLLAATVAAIDQTAGRPGRPPITQVFNEMLSNAEMITTQ